MSSTRVSVTEFELMQHQARVLRIVQMLEWPERAVCGYDCPHPGYCLECHCAAWNTMHEARQWIIDTLILVARTP